MIAQGLDVADAMRPGHGVLSATAVFDAQGIGAGLEYTHRITRGASAFASATAYYTNGRTTARGLAGLRWSF